MTGPVAEQKQILNELTGNEKLPKGTKKRKQKSDKTISLDI